MDNQLLVRVYNIGFGDCIYLRVPDKNRNVHILIDCGNKFGNVELLGECIDDLKKGLEVEGNKKTLDLLVVSHPHEDHHKGFEEEYFNDIKIKNIWLSPAYDKENPKAQGFHALKDAVGRALVSLEAFSKKASVELREEVKDLLSLTKSEALEMLNNTLPALNGIEPLYVTADTPVDDIHIFNDPKIKMKVLGPMSEIDYYYVGGNGLPHAADELTSLTMAEGYQTFYRDPGSEEVKTPRNISTQDFKLLCSRIYANALAVAEIASKIENNLSIVLLLEWHGRRLLFSGDAEWSKAHNGAVQPYGCNGSWNVMWQERKAELSSPLDFYKIGHHGSENATPWTPKKHPINEILDTLLPKHRPPRAYAVASTCCTKCWPSIPSVALLEEIGQRVKNCPEEYITSIPQEVRLKVSQPQRTDLEGLVPGGSDKYIEIKFKPVS